MCDECRARLREWSILCSHRLDSRRRRITDAISPAMTSGAASTSNAEYRSTSQRSSTSAFCLRRSLLNTPAALWNSRPSTSMIVRLRRSTRSQMYGPTAAFISRYSPIRCSARLSARSGSEADLVTASRTWRANSALPRRPGNRSSRWSNDAGSSPNFRRSSISNSASARGSTARQSRIVCAGVVHGRVSTSSTSLESSVRRCSRSQGGGRNLAERGTVASRVVGSVVQPRRYAADR